MRKVSGFYLTRHKKAKDLVREMELIDVDNQRQKLKKLVSQRKNKWRQTMTKQQLKLPKFNFLKKDYHQFSTIIPNAANQPFVTQKIKRKVATSDRAYSSSPNLKTGKIKELFQNSSDIDDPQVLNKKFMEYDRLIDSQSPLKKIQVLRQRENIFLVKQQDKDVKLKKTFFGKFTTDKYNFYKTNDYQSINSSTMSKCKTDRENNTNRFSQSEQCKQNITDRFTNFEACTTKSRYLQFTKSKMLNSTFDSTKKEDRSSLDCSSLYKSRFRTNREESDLFKKTVQSKSRIKSHNHKLSAISFQKNINSIDQ